MFCKVPRYGTIIQLSIRSGEYAATAPQNPAIHAGQQLDVFMEAPES